VDAVGAKVAAATERVARNAFTTAMVRTETRGNRMAAASREYIQGLKDGVTMYAWWKDGTQNVGTCGTTLLQAHAEIDKEYGIENKKEEAPNDGNS